VSEYDRAVASGARSRHGGVRDEGADAAAQATSEDAATGAVARANIHILGIRHHGPGSARAVRVELERLRPDAILVEGPADADPLVPLAVAAGMAPPVALLGYAPEAPDVAAFWPLAEFSPEWQALVWAGEHDVPLRFCDLPAASVLAGATKGGSRRIVTDPIAVLAETAGYDDPERWWDDVVESRLTGTFEAGFAAIGEAMAAVRSESSSQGRDEGTGENRREAYMRQVLRAVVKDGARRVVVVCGAWHAPALDARLGRLPSATADARTLTRLPRRKVSLTWVPWTHSRLAQASGYGAGVASPGWYHHLFAAPDRPVTRWLTRVAGVLRAEDLPTSSAHVIEAVRLAEALATLRRRPLAGLAEVTDATRAVLCDGDEVALKLVTDRLVVGEALGSVPPESPTVPLEADLAAQSRRLRLRREAEPRELDLDLRREIDTGRSVLLHRLRLLEVGWGVPSDSRVRSTGTFRETWTLRWEPELSVAVIEASTWGTTVAGAARAVVERRAKRASLADLTGLVESCLLADLPAVLPPLLADLDERAALDQDVAHLMAALPALVRSLRYGDVRGTDTAALAGVVDAMAVRICTGLPAAAGGLGDDAADTLLAAADRVHAAVALLDHSGVRDRWLATLRELADRADVHARLVGRAVRLLRDADRLATDDVAARLSRALSTGAGASAQAAWVDGFLARGGLLLVHDAELLGLLDEWVSRLGPEEFLRVLPLVRRTFGGFAPGERRGIGEAVKRPRRSAAAGATREADAGAAVEEIAEDRALPALSAVAALLGLPRAPADGGAP
jgi:hypothetical protein